MMPGRLDVLIIGGFGHVGLPLGIVLADSGLQVGLYDIDSSRRELIESGQMPFLEYDAEPILERVIGKTLRIADSLKAAQDVFWVVLNSNEFILQH